MFPCPDCGHFWNNPTSANTCCDQPELPELYTPRRHRRDTDE